MELREWVKAARGYGGMSQQQLARALQYTKSGVGGWETGCRVPAFRDQLAISKVTGYPLPGSPSERAMARGEPVGDFRHVSAIRWDIAYADINELSPVLAQQVLDNIKALADEARRIQRLETEIAVARAMLGKPCLPVGE